MFQAFKDTALLASVYLVGRGAHDFLHLLSSQASGCAAFRQSNGGHVSLLTSIMPPLRHWMDQRRWPWPLLLSCFVLGIVPSRIAEGHGYMSEPRSRAVDHLKGDIKGWPVSGAPPRYTRVDCLDLPANRQLTVVQPGPLKLGFVFPDGANHVGLCQAFLLNPEHPAQKLEIGEMMDCARSDHPGPGQKKDPDIPGDMMVTIPSAVPAIRRIACCNGFGWQPIAALRSRNIIMNVRISGSLARTRRS
ncbi:MAG TPA: hypothetical protein VGC82_05295 [Rhodopila sp.]|jgi:hypothetical protein